MGPIKENVFKGVTWDEGPEGLWGMLNYRSWHAKYEFDIFRRPSPSNSTWME